ncbi:ABC transporter permease [Cellulosilyticum sp. I15G10I2]|uniref:ABC transporter permease n=1 Tax=Cellulosilyticum sp. I15G10I2 TaxID=1892843 RepID=UPI00085CD606|nr:ABC transporter permease [Cellulosilyticum sp. I15G10I2]
MEISLFLSAAVIAGTPLLFATLGGILNEKVGNLNLGVEGMMLMGAIAGFMVGFTTNNALLALLGAGMVGALGALIYAVLTVSLHANQVVTGLSLTIFGTGFSGFLGQKMVGQIISDKLKSSLSPIRIPVLSEIPMIGEALFNQSPFVYFGFVSALLIFIYFIFTSWGLNARMVGENPAAADAAGINVNLYKYIHVLAGGAFCGLGGAFLSLVYVPAWQEGITAGRGWIAVALVIFAGWNPLKAILGGFLFGGLDILGFRLQGAGMNVNQFFLDMVPYIVTIVVLVIAGIKKNSLNAPPKGLGIAYFREER